MGTGGSGDLEIIASQNSVIEGNHFTRSASDQITLTAANNSCFNQNVGVHVYKIGDKVQRNMGRQMEFDFAKNFAIQNNIFDVSDGTLAVNFNDGETINAEGGGSTFLQDVGTTTSAATTTISANSNPNKVWDYGTGYKIAIVSGQGWGQWRNITSKSGNPSQSIRLDGCPCCWGQLLDLPRVDGERPDPQQYLAEQPLGHSPVPPSVLQRVDREQLDHRQWRDFYLWPRYK